LTPASYERLNVTLPVYVEWLLDTASPNGTQPVHFDPPRRLDSFDWFQSYESGFIVQQVYVDHDPSGVASDVPDYTPCLQGTLPERPQLGAFPAFTHQGAITVRDTHGGTTDLDESFLCLITVPHTPPSLCEDYYFVVFGFSAPGAFETYYGGEKQKARPTETVLLKWSVQFPEFQSDLQCPEPVYIVSHISTDIAGASFRYVDSSDLAALSAHMGQDVLWGWADDPNDFSNLGRTYHVNVNCYAANPVDFFTPGTHATRIDNSDLSVLAADIGKKHCEGEPAKADISTTEKQAILDWFGIAPTGRLITPVPGSEPIPEYDIVDLDKNRNAISDPYGYQRHLLASGAKNIP